MPRLGICGPTYASQSPNAAADLTMNLYPEIIESGTGNAPIVMYPTQGLKQFVTLPAFPVRGEFFINGRMFAVGGNQFCEVFSTGGITVWGTVANDSLPVTMAASPQQLLLASAGTAYVFDLTINTFTAIPGVTFSGPVNQAGICDGFFILTIANSKTFYVSKSLQALDWITNGSAIVSVFADNIVSMLVHDREIWFWSDRERTVYYDSGNLFPFDVIPGTTIQAGSAARSTPARLDDKVLWLNADDNGTATVKMGTGYTPTRVSNHALEFAMRGYARIDDAVGWAFQDQGHNFYVLYFPTPSATWVYDTITGMWHRRGYWSTTAAIFLAYRAQCHAFSFGKHLVGDWKTGIIYQMNIPVFNAGIWSFADDDGNPIVRIRRAPHVSKEQLWTFHHQLQVYLESGLGPEPQIAAPSLVLRDSNNNFWGVMTSSLGILSTTSGNPGPGQTLILNDPTGATSWMLGITTSGVLTTTSVPFNPAYPRNYLLQFNFNLGVTLVGVLTTSPAIVPATSTLDPQIALRWSDDGGHTWSNQYFKSAGQVGQYSKRVIWRRLGRSRDRVYEISMSDPIGWRIIDAYLQSTQGAS